MTKEEFMEECGYQYDERFTDWLFSNDLESRLRNYIVSDVDVLEMCELCWLAGLNIGNANSVEVVADSERMRWLLSGNGYFMEEYSLCGRSPCSEQEQSDARAEIDKVMKERTAD